MESSIVEEHRALLQENASQQRIISDLQHRCDELKAQYDSLMESLKKAQTQLSHSEKQRDSERDIYRSKLTLYEDEI